MSESIVAYYITPPFPALPPLADMLHAARNGPKLFAQETCAQGARAKEAG